MFCAVTCAPKQYHEHHPVGGDGVLSGGWLAARRTPTSPSATSREELVAVKNSSSCHDSPGLSVNPSASITTCNPDGGRRRNNPANRRVETKPRAVTWPGDAE